MLLVPGQSVTRALSMSVFAVGYALCKRPCQTMHALCWTTMFALLTDPTRAANFGFALSCSAVCGIAMLMPRIQAWCARWMPRGAAQALAMTVSAQVFTLSVQILISPQVPLWSIPANLMVAPFTDLATITGLLSCLCATVCPPVAPMFATVASWCTRPIALAAGLFGTADDGCIPWAQGAPGMLLMLGALTVGTALLIALHHLHAIILLVRRRGRRGRLHAMHPVDAARRWWRQTATMLMDIPWSHSKE